MIYIYCLDSIYKYFEDYIKSIKNLIGEYNIVLNINKINNLILLNYSKSNKYFFLKEIPNNIIDFIKNNEDIENIYMINTEQISKKNWKNYINRLPKNVKIIDYSYYNILLYDNNIKTQYIDYQYNKDEVLNLDKIKNITFIGSKSDYRNNILDKIKKTVYVKHIQKWGKNRDEELFQYKILVNISYNENYKIFETLRCYRCLFNKMIIISDIKDNINSLKYKDFIIFVEYDKLVDKVLEVYNNYEYYYKKLNLENIENVVKNNIQEFQLI
jgi:hypothetical protein